jgi:hypothetical protein
MSVFPGSLTIFQEVKVEKSDQLTLASLIKSCPSQEHPLFVTLLLNMAVTRG